MPFGSPEPLSIKKEDGVDGYEAVQKDIRASREVRRRLGLTKEELAKDFCVLLRNMGLYHISQQDVVLKLDRNRYSLRGLKYIFRGVRPDAIKLIQIDCKAIIREAFFATEEGQADFNSDSEKMQTMQKVLLLAIRERDMYLPRLVGKQLSLDREVLDDMYFYLEDALFELVDRQFSEEISNATEMWAFEYARKLANKCGLEDRRLLKLLVPNYRRRELYAFQIANDLVDDLLGSIFGETNNPGVQDADLLDRLLSIARGEVQKAIAKYRAQIKQEGVGVQSCRNKIDHLTREVIPAFIVSDDDFLTSFQDFDRRVNRQRKRVEKIVDRAGQQFLNKKVFS